MLDEADLMMKKYDQEDNEEVEKEGDEYMMKMRIMEMDDHVYDENMVMMKMMMGNDDKIMMLLNIKKI
jgi:hypothetical protein